ncbi:MAG: hypothetical protein PXY39_13540, partial [archaeon]|nr:hypothetical protein [archaeon]
VLQAEIRGRQRLYRQDPAIGRRLPDLFHRAGLKQITIDGAFEGANVPCDERTDLKSLRDEYRLSIEHLADQDQLKEYTKALVAGGLSKKKVEDYIRRYKARLARRLRILKSKKSKDRMTRFFAAPLFVAIGTK